jgi:hypothetical protein
MVAQTISSVVTGGLVGAALGGVTGWLVNKGPGAALGATIGGVALAGVGYLMAPPTSSGTGTGRPRMAYVRGRGISQLSPTG